MLGLTAQESAVELAIVLVHYRTPELVREAVDSLRRDLGAAADLAEWVLVDNGNDARGEELLRRLPLKVVQPGRNLGFAGGVNLGLSRTSAPYVLVLNPDVLVLPGCTRALVDRLRDGASVAGPRFYWDHGRRMLLPPPERRTRHDELWAAAAGWGPSWAGMARRRWRRHAWSHWRAQGPLRSLHLSGALLALRRRAFDRTGPFDEGFRLYFEETDWLLRLQAQGAYGEYVPGAEAVHLFARSAAREVAASTWFEESRRRFQMRHYGPWFELLWRLLARQPRPSAVPRCGDFELDLPPATEPRWVEVSPGSGGFPAAGERVPAQTHHWQLPAELRARLERGTYRLQLVSDEGRELLQRELLVCEGRCPETGRPAAGSS